MNSLQEAARSIFESNKRERARKNKQSGRAERDASNRKREGSGGENGPAPEPPGQPAVGLGLAMTPRSISLPSVNAHTHAPAEPTAGTGGSWRSRLSPLETNLNPSGNHASPTSHHTGSGDSRRAANRSADSPTNGSPSSKWPLLRSRSTSGHSFSSLTGMPLSATSSKYEAPLPALPQR